MSSLKGTGETDTSITFKSSPSHGFTWPCSVVRRGNLPSYCRTVHYRSAICKVSPVMMARRKGNKSRQGLQETKSVEGSFFVEKDGRSHPLHSLLGELRIHEDGWILNSRTCKPENIVPLVRKRVVSVGMYSPTLDLLSISLRKKDKLLSKR